MVEGHCVVVVVAFVFVVGGRPQQHAEYIRGRSGSTIKELEKIVVSVWQRDSVLLLLLLLFLLLLDVPSSVPCISETDLLRQSRSIRKCWVVCGRRTLCCCCCCCCCWTSQKHAVYFRDRSASTVVCTAAMPGRSKRKLWIVCGRSTLCVVLVVVVALVFVVARRPQQRAVYFRDRSASTIVCTATMPERGLRKWWVVSGRGTLCCCFCCCCFCCCCTSPATSSVVQGQI